MTPGHEVKIVNPETNEPLGAGEVGEICVRGFSSMRGYLNRPEEDAKFFGKV